MRTGLVRAGGWTTATVVVGLGLVLAGAWIIAGGHVALPFVGFGLLGLCALAVVARGVFVGALLLMATNGFPFVAATTEVGRGIRVQDIAIATLILVAAGWAIVDRGFQEEPNPFSAMLFRAGSCLILWWLFTIGRTVLVEHVSALRAVGFGRDFLYFGLLLCLMPRVLRTRRDLIALLAVLAGGTCLYALGQIVTATGLGTVDWLVHASTTAQQLGLIRVYSSMTDLVVVILALSLAALFFAPGLLGRVIAPGATLILTVSILLQLGRARWVGLGAGVLFVVTWALLRGRGLNRTRLHQRLSVVGVLLIAGGVVLLLAGADTALHGAVTRRVLSAFSDLESSGGTVAYRSHLISTLTGILGGKWPIGVGFIPAAAHYYFGLPLGSILNQDVGVLNALMTMGALGAVLLYWPVVHTLVRCLRAPEGATTHELEWLRYGGAVWIVGTLVSSVSLVTLFSSSGLAVTAAMLAIINHPSVLARSSEAGETDPARSATSYAQSADSGAAYAAT